ncbi:MAG TPA: class I SAM-dependent methyltransferase [Planctomycetota bacterium]|nr:class I SAM-dependent methyltransferase [Planctomycetota bacterium]
MPYDAESAIARFYDGDYAHFRTPSGDVAFYVEEALRAKGPVLELGCGTGRVLIPTAGKGVKIAGVDASEAMLARLREKHPAADVHLGDLRDFDLGQRRFALVTIPFRPIAHVIEAEDHVRLFRNVRRHLAPKGRLVFDFFHPKLAFLTAPRPEKLDFERAEGDLKIRRFSSTHPHVSRQVNDIALRWEVEHKDGRIEREESRFEMRWFYRFELEHVLARAGLVVEDLYGNFDRSDFGDDSPEMIFRARAS